MARFRQRRGRAAAPTSANRSRAPRCRQPIARGEAARPEREQNRAVSFGHGPVPPAPRPSRGAHKRQPKQSSPGRQQSRAAKPRAPSVSEVDRQLRPWPGSASAAAEPRRPQAPTEAELPGPPTIARGEAARPERERSEARDKQRQQE